MLLDAFRRFLLGAARTDDAMRSSISWGRFKSYGVLRQPHSVDLGRSQFDSLQKLDDLGTREKALAILLSWQCPPWACRVVGVSMEMTLNFRSIWTERRDGCVMHPP